MLVVVGFFKRSAIVLRYALSILRNYVIRVYKSGFPRPEISLSSYVAVLKEGWKIKKIKVKA